MSDINTVLQALGRIEGKLDSEIKLAEEHRADDVRRFEGVFKRLDATDKDINQAKGAKGAILWVASAIAAAVGFVVTMAAKAFGLQ